MASTQSVTFVESIYQRTDKHIRDLLEAQDERRVQAAAGIEIDTINVLIGGGGGTLAVGIAAAIRVDFRCTITGSYIQEFDGITGSVELDIGRTAGGSLPVATSIVGSTPPTISSGRYAADEDLVGWDTAIERGDLLLFSVISASSFTRLLVALRIQRLEP